MAKNLHIHASKLAPNLGEDTNVGTVDHTRPKEFQVGHVGVHAFKVDCLLNLCQFLGDEGRIRITMSVNCKLMSLKILRCLAIMPTYQEQELL
jgi:hypothetical protein